MAATIDHENGDPGFQIAPMVDVVFVLLLFFMATVGAQQLHLLSLPAQLPTPGAQRVAPVVVDIEIAEDGKVLMNHQVLGEPGDKSLGALRAWFTEAHERFGKQDPVLLSPAANARQERVMDVLTACVSAGVPNVTFR